MKNTEPKNMVYVYDNGERWSSHILELITSYYDQELVKQSIDWYGRNVDKQGKLIAVIENVIWREKDALTSIENFFFPTVFVLYDWDHEAEIPINLKFHETVEHFPKDMLKCLIPEWKKNHRHSEEKSYEVVVNFIERSVS